MIPEYQVRHGTIRGYQKKKRSVIKSTLHENKKESQLTDWFI